MAADPGYADCHVWLGQALGIKAARGGALMVLRYVGRVRGELEQGVALAPQNIMARFALQQFYLQAPELVGGNKGRAEAQATELGKARPLYGRMLAAAMDLDAHRYDAAERTILTVPRLKDPDAVELHVSLVANLATQYIREKRHADADRVLTYFGKRYPDESQVYQLRARSANEQGRTEEALALYEKAYAMDPSATGLYRIAQVRQALGQRDEAAQWLEKALAFKPGLPRGQRGDAEARLKALKG